MVQGYMAAKTCTVGRLIRLETGYLWSIKDQTAGVSSDIGIGSRRGIWIKGGSGAMYICYSY